MQPNEQAHRFILPRDTGPVILIAATSGMNAVFQWRHVRNVPGVKQCALDVCTALLEYPDLTNDKRSYQAIFVPAFIVGYRLTEERLRLLSEQEQEQELTAILAMDFTEAQLHLLASLAARMKNAGAQDIYDLIQKEASS
jgi:hypothetical protein